MKIGNIPFFIVFLSSLFPLLGALLNFNIYHLPAGLIASIGLILISQRKLVVKKNILTTVVAPTFLILLVIQVITGRGFVILGVGGYVLIFALIFFVLFTTETGSSLQSMVHGISFLYKFFLIGMLIEAALIMLGLQPQLVSILTSNNSPGYKDYNSADVLRYFGLMQNAGGLNSVLLGSQISGMLSLFSAIWFVGIRKFRAKELVVDYSKFWIVLSCLVFLITVNGLNFLLLTLAGSAYLLFSVKINRVKVACLLGLSIAGLYLLIVNDLVFSRILNENLIHLQPSDIEISRKYGILDEVQALTTKDYYIYQFSSPIRNWFAEGWVNKLFGVGAQYFLNDDNFIAGDFGFGVGMLSSGALWISIFSLAVIGSCLPALKGPKLGSNEGRSWSVLGAMNALITLLWLASTIHYNQAFANPGGMTLFALHFAATLYCRYRYSLYRSKIVNYGFPSPSPPPPQSLV